MTSVNKVILIGGLGKDPETRYAPSGDAITTISLATTETWKDKASGEKKEATEWHRVVFFGRLAEIAAQYLKKGTQVYVEGSIKTRKWQDKEGVDRYSTEIKADQMKMLGGGQGQQNNNQQSTRPNNRPANKPANQPHSKPASSNPDPFDDDIPF